MRSSQYARSLRALSQGSAIVLLGGLLSACSSSMTRFDDVLTTGSVMTDNQRSIVSKPVTQPYPGAANSPVEKSIDTDYASPSVSTNRISVPKPQPLSPIVASQPLPAATGIKIVKPAYSAPTPPIPPAPVEAKTTQPIILAPRSTEKKPLSLAGADKMSTGSVVRKAPEAVLPPSANQSKAAGWEGAGGSKVTVKPGETLYNLSRRYGVPVGAIMKANGFEKPSQLVAGNQIMIPAYTYDKSAKVSAPDNDPMTKAARATTGFKGQVKKGPVAVPKERVIAQPKVQPKMPVSNVVQPAAKSPVVAAVQTKGVHTVASGDTLYSIARRYGTSAGALQKTNKLSNDSIRVGQRLSIPTVGATTQTAAKPKSLPKAIVDAVKKPTAAKPSPMVTGSVPKQSNDGSKEGATQKRVIAPAPAQPKTVTIAKRSSEKVETPSKTQSATFRWPTNGRVIAKFGERVNGNTNDGIDISVPAGTPVKAAENGTVIYSGSELADFGNLILVSHQGGWVSAYAHASKNSVKRGDKVKRGQVIAISGKSGNATRPKLHFELRKDSVPVNPLKHLGR